MEKFFSQLRQRQIFKVAIIYIVATWPLIQIVDIAIPVLGLPESVLPLLFKVFLVGFPISLIFAWLTNFTADGLVKASSTSTNPEKGESTNKFKANLRAFSTIGGALVMAAIITLGSQLLLGSKNEPRPVANNQNTATPAKSADDDRESLAVLPFEVFSNDVQDEYFVDGMVEELLNLLAGVPELSVAARTSSFAYKGVRDKTITQIGHELGVDTILEGSIRKNDLENRIRVTAQLINVADGSHLFSETFDREYRDIFQIQDEIAKRVTERMKSTLLGSQKPIEFVAGTTNVDAMVEYGKGQKELGHRTAASLQRAIQHFNKATALDDGYARAHVGTADATLLLALYGTLPRETAYEVAQKSIEKALALQPELAAAHASQGLLYTEQHEKTKAEEAFQKAIELNPNYAMAYMWYGSLKRDRGEHSGANELFAKASELDPKSPVAAYNVAWGNYQLGNETVAMEWFSKIVANDPYYPGAYSLVGHILRNSGRLAESSEMFRRALKVDPSSKQAVSGLLINAMDLQDEGETDYWFEHLQDNPSILTTNELHQLEARYFLAFKKPEEAIKALEKLEFSQSEQFIRLLLDGEVGYYLDDNASAIKHFEQLRQTNFARGPTFLSLSDSQPAVHLAQAYLRTNANDQATQLLKELKTYLTAELAQNSKNATTYYTLALVYAMQGDANESINHLQAAIDSGWVQVWQAEIEPILFEVAKEPRFELMMGGVKARLAYMRSRLNNSESAGFAERG